MSKSIVDRILSGEFDDEELDQVQLSGSPTPSTSNSVNYAEDEDGDPGDEDEYDDDEDQTVTEEEDMEEEELEELLEEVEDRVLEDRLEELEAEDDTDYSNYVPKPESLPLSKKQKVLKTKKEPKTMTNKSKSTTASTATLSPPTKPTQGGRGRPHKLAAHFKEIVRLYTEGLSTKVIAEQYKVSVACVIASLKANGATIRPKGRRSRKGA